MKISIYTLADKRPEFIRWQKITFDHFLSDPFEYVVVNNASAPGYEREIGKICKELRIRMLELPVKHHEDPNIANAYPVDYLIQEVISKDKETNITIVIDSDMFLIKPFSPSSYLGENWIAGLPKRRGPVNYLWVGLVMINHETIKNIGELNFCCMNCINNCPYYDSKKWYWGTINGQRPDVGGGTYFYLHEHPDCLVREMWSTGYITPERSNLKYLPQEILSEYDPQFKFEMLDQTFFHYTAGSNWRKEEIDFHTRKTRLAEKFIKGAMDGTISTPNPPRKKKYKDPEFQWTQYRFSLRYYWKKTLSWSKKRFLSVLKTLSLITNASNKSSSD